MQTANNKCFSLLPAMSFWVLVGFFFLASCQEKNASPADLANSKFFEEKNAQHGGDYVATFPLHDPDSCLLRLKAEVPKSLQPWICLSIWYHLPRTSPEVSFRWLELYENNYPHDTVSAFAQMARAEFLIEMGKMDSAQAFLDDARQRYLKLNRPLDASDADLLLARAFFQKNDFANALAYNFKVLALLNQHDTSFSPRHAFTYLDISTDYAGLHEFQKTLLWQQKGWSADYSKIEEPWKYKAQFAQKMSTSYARMERFDSSLIMAKLAIELFTANSKKPLPAELGYRLGYAYAKMNEFGTALPLLRRSYQLMDNSPNTFMRNQIEQSLAECYFGLGKLDSAQAFFEKALATPDTGNLATAHSRLAEIHARRGDFKTAYAAEKQSGLLYRSVFAREKVTAFADFQARYENQQNERRIADLESKQKIARQKNLIFALALLSLALFLLAMFLRQRSLRRITEHEKLLLEKDKNFLAQENQLAQALAQLKTKELERSEASLKEAKDRLDMTNLLLELKNQFIEELQLRLHRQSAKPPSSSEAAQLRADETPPDLHRMKILTDEDWSRFRERFEQAFPKFQSNLKSSFSDLTAAETRLFLLFKLKFTNKEASEALGISLESVYRSRNRLAKKLGVRDTALLDVFIRQFE